MTYARDEGVRALASHMGAEQDQQNDRIGAIEGLSQHPVLFGAVGDGVADDTAAVQAWADAGGGTVNGRYRLTSPVMVNDKSLVIRAAGEARPAFIVEGGVGISVSRSATGASANVVLDMEGVDFIPDGAGTATAILLEETRPSAGTQVCGGVDFLRMRGVSFRSGASNYWRHSLHTVNAGGVTGSDITFGDHASHSAQANPLSRHVRIENTQSNIFVIRALQLVNAYFRRAHKHVEVSALNSIESLYISTAELVGALRIIELNGPGNIGAISLIGLHGDTSGEFLWGADDTAVTLARVTGCDLRKGNNGSPFATGALIRVARGETLIVSGTMFSGTSNRTPPGPADAGIIIEGGFTRAVIDSSNTFRNMATGVAIRGGANRVSVGAARFDDVALAVENLSPSSLNEIATGVGDFAGMANDLAGAARGVTEHRIVPGVSGVPAGAGASGGMLRTVVFDANAAYQRLLSANNPSLVFVRRKSAGTWGEWQRVSVLPANGPRDLSGAGTPEGVVAAPVGSTYRRTDGGAGTSFYVKESGSGSTGWVAK